MKLLKNGVWQLTKEEDRGLRMMFGIPTPEQKREMRRRAEEREKRKAERVAGPKYIDPAQLNLL